MYKNILHNCPALQVVISSLVSYNFVDLFILCFKFNGHRQVQHLADVPHVFESLLEASVGNMNSAVFLIMLGPLVNIVR
jgi:hypothetical protein